MAFTEVTRFADMAIMLPAAAVVASWLLLARSPRAALAWLAVLGASYLPVIVSKLAFKGWGLGIRSLDFAVISGQALNATLMGTVLLSLLTRQLRPRLRWPAGMAGLCAGGWFALTRVAGHSHSLSEALLGFLLGAAAAGFFLRRLERYPLQRLRPLPLLLGIGLIGYATTLPRLPVEEWLDRLALGISGHAEVFVPGDWQR